MKLSTSANTLPIIVATSDVNKSLASQSAISTLLKGNPTSPRARTCSVTKFKLKKQLKPAEKSGNEEVMNRERVSWNKPSCVDGLVSHYMNLVR